MERLCEHGSPPNDCWPCCDKRKASYAALRVAERDERITALEIERDKLAEIVTRNDGAVERSQELARELGEALTAKAEVREQLSAMAMSNAQLLLDNLELRTAKTELVAVLRTTEAWLEQLHLAIRPSVPLVDLCESVSAALAKRGGDDARGLCGECGHHRNQHASVAPTNGCLSCHCPAFVEERKRAVDG